MKNPRLDLCFGVKQDAFSPDAKDVNDLFSQYTMISSEIYHAAFTVEVKSAQGSIEDAENQSCRSGAAMVAARRQFNAAQFNKARTNLGPDLDSFCFTMSLVPQMANIHMHWAEVKKENTTIYYMNVMKSYVLHAGRGAQIRDLRHNINNILDWMTLTRRNAVQAICDKIQSRIELSPLSKRAKTSHKDSREENNDDNRE